MTNTEIEEANKLKTEITLLRAQLLNAHIGCIKCEKECSEFRTVYRLEIKDIDSSKWHRVLNDVSYYELKHHLKMDYRTKDLIKNGNIRIKSRRMTNWAISNEEFFCDYHENT